MLRREGGCKRHWRNLLHRSQLPERRQGQDGLSPGQEAVDTAKHSSTGRAELTAPSESLLVIPLHASRFIHRQIGNIPFRIQLPSERAQQSLLGAADKETKRPTASTGGRMTAQPHVPKSARAAAWVLTCAKRVQWENLVPLWPVLAGVRPSDIFG